MSTRVVILSYSSLSFNHHCPVPLLLRFNRVQNLLKILMWCLNANECRGVCKP